MNKSKRCNALSFQLAGWPRVECKTRLRWFIEILYVLDRSDNSCVCVSDGGNNYQGKYVWRKYTSREPYFLKVTNMHFCLFCRSLSNKVFMIKCSASVLNEFMEKLSNRLCIYCCCFFGVIERSISSLKALRVWVYSMNPMILLLFSVKPYSTESRGIRLLTRHNERQHQYLQSLIFRSYI